MCQCDDSCTGKHDELNWNLEILVKWIDRLCGLDVHVTSGWRCAKHNDFVGGVATSKHLVGAAVDLWCDYHPELVDSVRCLGMYPFEFAFKWRYKIYKTHIHVELVGA